MTILTSTVLERVVHDLSDETTAVVSVLAGLRAEAWHAATPAKGWTILDQVTHLAYFDDATRLALQDPAAFLAQRSDLLALGDRFPDVVAERHGAGPHHHSWRPPELRPPHT